MTAASTYRDHLAGLEALARANAETDFADMIRAYSFALSYECWDSAECRDYAQQFRDEAERVARRFEQAADALEDFQRQGMGDE